MSRRKKDKQEDDDNGFGAWGGYMEAKKSKLMEQFKDNAEHQIEKISDIFKGIAIYVNGFTTPSASELKVLMAQHGGTFHMYQVFSTTHIIASMLPNVKVKHLGSVPIVKVAWIVESIALQKLIDYRRYLLYTNQSSTQPRLDFPIVAKSNLTVNDKNMTFSISSVGETSKPCVANVKISEGMTGGRISKTASDPMFLEEFYNNSRLHLISTLGSEFKQLVGQLREKSNGIFPGRLKLAECKRNSPTMRTYNSVIMHIDMDCFFVSVGLRTRPELRGKPVAVTHARNGQLTFTRPGRTAEIALNKERNAVSKLETVDAHSSMSEVASCSYEARKCGVSNGMFLGAAVKLCPGLIPIPYDFQGYREVSSILFNTVASYTLDIEAVSCDEMYVDVTPILNETGASVHEWATRIRDEITRTTGCPCSAGFGSNRLQARLATKRAKPAGQFYLEVDDVEAYMSDIKLADLPGVGRATLARLKILGLNTCGDVQVASLSMLQSELGVKAGETLLEQSKGIDKKPLNYCQERKSVSAEINYGIRFKSLEESHRFLQSLAQEVCSRLAEVGMMAKCLTLKLMVRAPEAPVETAKFLGHGMCDNLTKSASFNFPIGDFNTIFREVKSLYEKLNPSFVDLRGVGIQLSRLEKFAVVNNKVLTDFLKHGPSKKDATGEKEKNVSKVSKISQKEDETTFKEIEATSSTVKVGNSEPEKKQTVSKTTETNKRKKNVHKKGSTKSVQKTISISSVNDFFKGVGNVKSSSEKEVSQKSTNEKIDMDVLNQLPESIRNEIIKEYGLDNHDTVKKKTDKPQNKKDTSSTLSNNNKGGRNVDEQESDVKKSPFENLCWDQLKLVIKHWIESEQEPLNIDVLMIADHFKRWAIDRKIEILKIVFNFLHRTFSKMNCKWHKAYFAIVDATQEGMVARYGSTLMVKRHFDCCQ